MAQAGFTPIQLYFSTTASATPSAGNLANGELAINITDGRLFYKDNAGAVQVIGTKGGVGTSTNTQVLFNSSGSVAGSANMVFNGTRLTVADFADSSLTSGRVTYAGAGGNLTDSANLTFDGTTLTANALTVSNAVTLSGGTANGVAYLNGSKVVTTGSALQFNGTILGLGATPTAWGGSGVRAIDIGSSGAVAGSGSDVGLVANAYYDGNNWIYKNSSLSARYQQLVGSGAHLWFSAPSGTAGANVSYEQLMQLTFPGTRQAVLTVGQGLGGATERNTIVMANGGYSDQPGNLTTASNGDKFVLYAGSNRSAMGIGNDYNWWSQSKSFEWWISPNSSSTTVTKQLTLTQTGLDFGVSNDSVPRRISVAHSSVPTYISSSFDGTNAISTFSTNTWSTSNGVPGSWSAFGNTNYSAAAIQLLSNTSNSYIVMGAASSPNVTPTASFWVDRFGFSTGISSLSKAISGTTFANYISQANLSSVSSTNRVLAIDSTNTSASIWFGLSAVAQYAMDYDAANWQRWVNSGGTWFNTHNINKATGLEREIYNPGFVFQVATGTNYGASWNRIIYDVSGGSRTLTRDGTGYDPSNGRFTAALSGWYHFSAQISFSASNDVDGTIKFIINGNTSSYSPSSSAIGGNVYPGSRQVSGTLFLNVGDYVETWCFFSGSTNTVRGGQPFAGTFSGHFVG